MTDLEKELLIALMDVLAQACAYGEPDNPKYGDFGISAYEDAVDLLVRLGYAKWLKGDGFELFWPVEVPE